MLNKIIVMGRLTRDPELRRTQSGLSVTSFSVACDRDFKSQSGEKETDFIDIVAWRQTAEFVCKYFSKGRMAVVEGRLQIRDWQDNNGNKRRSAEIVADNIYFGDSKRDGDGGGYPQGSYAPQGGYPQQGPSYGAPGGSSYGASSGGYPASDYGGDFAGIQQKLPYLCDLGVSCIYLNPIFEAHANHRYNTANYLKADPLLGTNEEFAALCAAAAKEGIRIILDGVFSHTGSDSVYFNREGRYGPGGAYRDRNSPYRSWYDFDSGYPSGYRCWWGFETLPEVQEDSPSYIDFVCGKGGVIDTWLGLGASGFRLDVADELPDAFIERIRQAVKAHGEDKLLIGEVWEDATTKEAFGRRRTYLRGKGLDAVMNYPFRNAALSYVTGSDVHAVAEQILSICENYPAPALNCAMNFLSTHDTERAITAIAGEPANGRDRYWQSGRHIPAQKMDDAMRKLLLGYAMIFTLPGVPCIYYGDEIAMQGYRDPFNRAFFDWNSTEQRLRGPLKTLAHLRKGCDAFDGGRLEIVRADTDVLHYRRIGKTQTAEIILNRGPHLIAELAFGKYAEVNPGGFTVLVEENRPEHVGYFSIY